MRKLATIQKIRDIRPIEGADAIELAFINNWQVVVAKNVGHKVGDIVVYCEIDSFLPVRDEFEFLRKSSFKKMGDQEGFRLKTIKLRGQISQGLILPLSVFSGYGYRVSQNLLNENPALEPSDIAISPSDMIELLPGNEVTDILGIVKYEPPIPAELSGKVKGLFPSFIRKTDEERVQNLTEKYDKWRNEFKFYATEKLDGSSATFYYRDGVFGVCSRNLELSEPEPFEPGMVMCDDGIERPKRENTYWKVAKEMRIKEKMEGIGKNLAIQGELIGEGIQGNPYKIKGQTFRLFNIFDIDTQSYYELPMFLVTAREVLDLPTVPIIAKYFDLPESIEKMLELAEGKSELCSTTEREGLVIRSIDRTVSFKAISNRFLLKEN